MRLSAGQRVKLVYKMDSVSVPVDTEGTVLEVIYPAEQRLSAFGEPVVMVDFGEHGEHGFEMCLFPCTVRPI